MCYIIVSCMDPVSAIRKIHDLVDSDYELRNSIERYLIANLNETKNPFASTDETRAQLSKEIAANRSRTLSPDKIFDILDSVKKSKNAVHQPVSDPVKVAFGGGLVTITCGEASIKCSIIRYKLLKKVNEAGLGALVRRYYVLMPGSVQWSIDPAIYARLHADGYNYEAFASPFNSQLFGLGGHYCSVYTEDSAYAGIGNFFAKTTQKKLCGKKIVVNPPFTEVLLSRAADVAIELSRKGSSIYFYGPLWRDADFYTKLSSVPGAIYAEMRPGEHRVYDNIRGTFTAKFGACVFKF